MPPDLDSLQQWKIKLLAAITFQWGLKLCGLEMFEDHQNGLNFKVNSMKSIDTHINISNRFVIVLALSEHN